jgi:hypothetical protein
MHGFIYSRTPDVISKDNNEQSLKEKVVGELKVPWIQNIAKTN